MMKFLFFIATILFSVISTFSVAFSVMAFINSQFLAAIYLLLLAQVFWRFADYFEEHKEKYDG